MAEALRPSDGPGGVTQPPSLRRASEVLAAMIAAGVRDIVTCPGSRNAPLLYAAAAAQRGGRVRLHPRSDERSAAFLALGLSLGSDHRPVAVMTTSGTAVANLHPAMLEAAYAGVPIIAVTADRTAAQRAGGANQSVRQSGIFGPDIETIFIDVTADGFDAADALRARLAAAARLEGLGPIHLNMEFGDPLVPALEPGVDPIAALASQVERDLDALAARWGASSPVDVDEAVDVDDVDEADGADIAGEPAHDAVRSAVDAHNRLDRNVTAVVRNVTAVVRNVTAVDRTLVIAGSGADPHVAELCLAQGWPLIAEVVAGVDPGPLRVTDYRRALDAGLDGEDGCPQRTLVESIEQIIVCGRPTLSRQVSRLIEQAPGRVISVGQYPGGQKRFFDPGLRANAKYGELPREWLVPGARGPERSAWLRAWTSAPVTRFGDSEAGGGPVADAGAAAVREVFATARAGDAIVLGPSRVIRHADQCDVAAAGVAVFSNRGASGIDGVVSTAVGVALSWPRGSVRAIMGDLTFLHDMCALQLGRGVDQPQLQVIVVNDNGGTIFTALEHGEVSRHHSSARDAVVKLLTTPASANIEFLCRAFGVRYSKDLAGELAYPAEGITVIEVPADAPFS